MKTTKNVFNIRAFHNVVKGLASSDGVKFKHITFSSLGYEKLKQLQVAEAIYPLSSKETGDVIGFLGEDVKYPTFFVTGKTPDTKIKAPANLSSAFAGFGKIGMSDLDALKTIDVSGLDTRNVQDFAYCFSNVGQNNPDGVKIIGLSEWNTSKAKSMRWMFMHYNDIAESAVLDLSNFDVSSVTKFTGMFFRVGQNAKELEIRGIENWEFLVDENGFAYMDNMFYKCGQMADFSLDLSNWKPDWVFANLTFRRPKDFAAGTFFKIKEPYPNK